MIGEKNAYKRRNLTLLYMWDIFKKSPDIIYVLLVSSKNESFRLDFRYNNLKIHLEIFRLENSESTPYQKWRISRYE